MDHCQAIWTGARRTERDARDHANSVWRLECGQRCPTRSLTTFSSYREGQAEPPHRRAGKQRRLREPWRVGYPTLSLCVGDLHAQQLATVKDTGSTDVLGSTLGPLIQPRSPTPTPPQPPAAQPPWHCALRRLYCASDTEHRARCLVHRRACTLEIP